MNDESNQGNQHSGNVDTKQPRSKAQQEASRKNGAKSKGPASEHGKRKSRRNALRHGLTAKFLTPPKDTRNQHQFYEQIYQELFNEYEPEGFTSEMIISNLANDYVQMIRCRQMMEALQRPNPLSDEDQKAWDTVQVHKESHRYLKEAIECLVAKKDLGLPKHVAREFAEAISEHVKELARDIEEIDGYGEEKPEYVNDLQTFDDEEIEERQQLWNKVKAVRKRLTLVDHLTRIFTGDAVPGPMEPKRILVMLREVEHNIKIRPHARPNIEARVEQSNYQFLVNLANEPQRIMLLERYLRDIERSIDRKFKQLRDLESLGSFRENDW